MKKTLEIAATLCLAVVLAGCSAQTHRAEQPAEGGPMKIGGEAGELCLSLDETPGPDLTYAIDQLYNGSDRPLEITGLQAINAHNVRVGESFVVTLKSPGTLIGASTAWPAKVTEEAGIATAWKNRQALAGYTLPAGGKGVSYNLVVRLIADEKATSGSIDALQIDYRFEGSSYRVGNTTKIVLKPSCL